MTTGMNQAKCAFALLAVLCIGCKRGAIPSDISERIDDSVAAVRGDISLAVPVADQSIAVAEAIYRIPDRSRQAACFEVWLSRLLSVETQAMGYGAIRDYLNNLYGVFHVSVAFGLEQVHAAPEMLINARVALVMRLEKELNRIRPKKARDRSLAEKDAGSVRRYEEWRRCYLTVYRLHRLCLDRLEGRDFWRITAKLVDNHRETLRKQIENRLGRALRTKEAVQADKSVDTDEYKLVLSRQVEP